MTNTPPPPPEPGVPTPDDNEHPKAPHAGLSAPM